MTTKEVRKDGKEIRKESTIRKDSKEKERTKERDLKDIP